MSYRIETTAPYMPHLVEEEFVAYEIEDAAQTFQKHANPPEQWKLAEIVEELAVNDRVEYTRPDEKTVRAVLVKTGATV